MAAIKAVIKVVIKLATTTSLRPVQAAQEIMEAKRALAVMAHRAAITEVTRVRS